MSKYALESEKKIHVSTSTQKNIVFSNNKDRNFEAMKSVWCIFIFIKMKNEKYYIVRTVPKSNRKILHCQNISKI